LTAGAAASATPGEPAAAAAPTFAEAVRVWWRVGLLSFGGPAGQIAVLHRIVVEEKRWVDEGRFLHALQYCMLLPGPEAQQLATYLGWWLHGWRGGLAAGTLFLLPGCVVMLGLSLFYVSYRHAPWTAALLFGLKAVVVAIVFDALWRIGRRALTSPGAWAVAIAAFASMFLLRTPFALVVVAAALLGIVGRGRGFGPQARIDAGAGPAPTTRWRRLLAIAASGAALWWLPVGVLAMLLGAGHVVVRCGTYFGTMAMLSFGGAYAVLAYVAQDAVHRFAWLTPAEMLDGLGLAETTPGPLVLVLQFVGFLAGFREPGTLTPYASAIAASLVTLWVTFVPSFLWIFLGAPYVERLRANRILRGAFAAVSASVVGVILNLAVWLALHILFGRVTERRWGAVHAVSPDLATLDGAAATIAVVALVALRLRPAGLLPTLALGTAAGAAWTLSRG
jgi:chromate transporter